MTANCTFRSEKFSLPAGRPIAKKRAANFWEPPKPTKQQERPKMTKHSIAASCALTLAAFGFASTTFAGPDVKETKDIKETVKESCISGDLGVTMPTEYISRGLVMENQGV